VSVALAILGAITAVFKGLGILAQSLYYNRAKDAGHTEAELAVTKRDLQNVEVRHDAEDSIRGSSPDDLERLLN
jgi:hypothetical protein